ncbi:MAG: MBL fold metallo-hydrolase [Oscillospiraceae bacterium]|nr:MBL fold metallo-hydrolase [Oscillospiraceae bacterium]
MAKITFLGTCSGTEPFEGMHHTSFIIEANGNVYWFDAGENCSRNAFLNGIDILAVNSIFISHPHVDHIGGLFNLILLVRQQIWRQGKEPEDGKVRLFSPCKALWEHMKPLIDTADKNLFNVMSVENSVITDGVIFENEDIKVSAIHNEHMGVPEDGEWKSYSFLIETSGKRIVYSGDIGAMSELDSLIGDGCDILICETGHHKVSDVIAYAEKSSVAHLVFNHHGREIIYDRAAAQELCEKASCKAEVAYDGMELGL